MSRHRSTRAQHQNHAAVHFAKDVVKESRVDCAEARDSLEVARGALRKAGAESTPKARAAVARAGRAFAFNCRVR